MAISQKDIKLLWGRSGNRCSICKAELTQDGSAASAAFTLGEMAHIVGDKDVAARGESILSSKERDSYHNLILLCPNDHTLIDNDVAKYPVEKLHQIKSEHELWVRETLSGTEDLRVRATKLIISDIVDATVNDCKLSTWRMWTSWALSTDPIWEIHFPYQLVEYLRKVKATLWPEELKELKAATLTLANSLHRAAQEFLKHSHKENDYLRATRFYRENDFDNFHKYRRDAKRYEDWLDTCYDLIVMATKAANWFAEIVRRDVNPFFFIENGKFGVLYNPFEDSKWEFMVPEFNDSEKQSLLDSWRD